MPRWLPCAARSRARPTCASAPRSSRISRGCASCRSSSSWSACPRRSRENDRDGRQTAVMLLALLACLGLQTPPTYTQIQARVPKTNWVVLFLLHGWKEAGRDDPLLKELGDKVVLSGVMDPPGTVLTVIAEPNTQLISPAALRTRFARPGEEFDVQLSACVDASLKVADGPAYSDYHAYTCAAGYCFDVHVSRV